MTITLGNFSSVNGRTVLTGLSGSGLDTEGLINSLSEARRLPAIALEDSIELNTNRSDAFSELRTILSNLRDATDFLRSPQGVQNEASNVFRYRSASVSSDNGIAASTYLNVTTEPGASIQNYNVTDIASLARTTKQRTSSFDIASASTSVVTTAATPGFFRAGTVTINGANITLTAGDTLNNVASKFNEVRATTGIEAGIIQSGTGAYVLSFTATDSGTAAAFDLNDPGTVTSDPNGVLNYISRTNLLTGGTYSGSILTNGTFDNDINSFTNLSLGTGVVSHDGAGAMQLDGDGDGGNEAFAQQSFATEIGKTYTVSATLDDLSNSAFLRIGSGSDVNAASNSDIANFEVSADGTVSFTFTATSTTSYLTIDSATNTDSFTVDNLSVTENITDFTDLSAGTGSLTPASSGGLSLIGGGAGNEAYAQQAIATEIGKTYTLTFDHNDALASGDTGNVRIGTNASTASADNFNLGQQTFNGDGTTTITFTATSTTSYVTFDSASSTNPLVLNNMSVVEDGIGFTDTQTASDAVFVIDGITVTRDTNTITDVIDGVTFNLQQETPDATSLSVNIVADQTLPTSGVTNFISAFNELRIFVVQQSATDEDGVYNEEAYLAGENILRSITSSLATELSSSVSGAGTYKSLGEVGITFADLPESADTPATNNILNIDSQVFSTALSADFESIEKLFGFSYTTNNANVAIFESSNAATASSFSLDIDPDAGKFQANINGQTVNLTATQLGSSGYRLVGPSGSALEGLTLIYASTEAGTANVTQSQGVADRIFNSLDGILDEQEGSLQLEIDAVTDSSTRLQAQIDRIDDQVERYREQLIRQYSALEATLSSLNTLLDSLAANQDFLTNS